MLTSTYISSNFIFAGHLFSTMAQKNNILKSASNEANQPFTVFIEGNIGSGKTTFLNYFKKYDEVCLQTEPVEKWRDLGGVNLLVRIRSIKKMFIQV